MSSAPEGKSSEDDDSETFVEPAGPPPARAPLPDIAGLAEWFENDGGGGDATGVPERSESVLPVRVGERFAGHRLERVLGRGGMGAVFVGVDDRGVRRAIKVSLFGPDHDTTLRERFRREVEALAKVPPHPNVLGVHGAGEERGHAFCTTELVVGTPLDRLLGLGVPVAPARALELAEKIARALAHVHAHGVVHRDVKPANVLVRESDGEPVLIDFGIARNADADRMTRSGDVLGSPQYMSPEQAMGLRDIDARSDVFSLGTVLHELLTGDPPFRGIGQVAIIEAILHAEPEPPSKVRRGVSPAVDGILRRALAKAPKDRYQSAAELALDLSRLREAEAGPDGRSRARVWLALAVLLAGLAVAGVLSVLALRAVRRAGWRDEARAQRASVEADRRAFRGALLARPASAAAPVFSGTSLAAAEAHLARPEAAPEGDPSREALRRSCAAARVEALLAGPELEKARAAADAWPEGDPERALLVLEAALAAARAEALAGQGTTALRRLDRATAGGLGTADSHELRRGVVETRRVALLAAARDASTPGELALLLDRTRDGAATRGEVVAAVLSSNARAPAVLRQVGADEPALLDSAEAVPVLLEWSRDAAASGELVQALELLARARARAPACEAPAALPALLDEQGDALLDRRDAAGWLALALAALRAGYPVDVRAWPESFALDRRDVAGRLEARIEADASDWPAKLLLAGIAVAAGDRPREGAAPGDEATRASTTRAVRLLGEVLAAPGTPRLATALALELRGIARARAAGVGARAGSGDMGSDLPAAVADLERAAELGGPGRARSLYSIALVRFMRADEGTLIEIARRSCEAARERWTASQGGRWPDEGVLDRPWRQETVAASLVDSDGLLLVLALKREARAPEVDALVAEIQKADADGDRAALSLAYAQLVRGERDEGLATIEAAWRACRARTDARARTVVLRFFERLAATEQTLLYVGRADDALAVRRTAQGILERARAERR